MSLPLQVHNTPRKYSYEKIEAESHQDSVSNYQCTGNIESLTLSPGPFGMLALGSFYLGIQWPCFEKLKSHGEAARRHFWWQLQLSFQLIVLTAISVWMDHLWCPADTGLQQHWETPNENHPADPSQPKEPQKLIMFKALSFEAIC